MFGIVVGIFVLTVLGGMTTRLNQQVNGMKGLIEGKITIVPADTGMMNMQGKLLGLSTAREIEKQPGVANAAGMIQVQLKGSHGPGNQQMIEGYEVENMPDLLAKVRLSDGRYLNEGDTGKVVLGASIAQDLSAGVGSKVDLKGRQFEVVGIMDQTLGAEDSIAFVPFKDALAILLAENPFYKDADVAQQIEVVPKQGTDAEALASELKAKFPSVKVISPKEAEKQISQITTIFTAIILGIAFIALFVGGLSIINTMIMSVSERRREIGLKKAIGAKTWEIMVEYLSEASMIGLTAGVVGVLLGMFLITIMNKMTSSSNNITVFTINAMVALGPIVFAVVLAAVAGFFPAIRAARLNPVDALKEE